MPHLRPSLLAALLVALVSCQYAGDRAMDFLDQGRVAVGAGTTAGVRGRYFGLVETGLLVGVKPKLASLGWRYGEPLFLNQNDATLVVDQAELIQTTSITDLDVVTGRYGSARNSAAILPALFTWADSSPTDYEWRVPAAGNEFAERYWLWSAESFRRNRYAQLHAFDVELEVALGLYVELGYSPGETLDFLLGFLTLDIAGDDDRF